MKKMAKEEIESEEEVLEEDQVSTDEVVAEVEEYDIDEDVNALLGGEELSEEFREKAKTIFEAALTSKVKEIQETLETQYAEALAEEAQAQKAQLQERVDSYLEYVAQEWMSENQLAIEHGLKTEMTESFLGGMKSLFEEHYVTIPEDKYDVLESMVEKLDDMETKLNEQIEKNISLNGRLAESVADGILDSVSEGLASTQKEKLASLAESVEFESEEEYREKLETLRESYFSRTATAKSEASQTISEGVDSTPAPIGSSMDAYLRTLGAFKK
jgi:outer membrane protein OmpA-like peptidoglycan-associated protein